MAGPVNQLQGKPGFPVLFPGSQPLGPGKKKQAWALVAADNQSARRELTAQTPPKVRGLPSLC